VLRVIEDFAEQGYALLHEGRDCANWWAPLGMHTSPKECARVARRMGYKGFVFQSHPAFQSWDGKYFCWSDDTEGVKDQAKDGNPFDPVDETCTCTDWWCTGKEQSSGGWKEQQQFPWYGAYSHYMVIESKTEFLTEAYEKPFASSSAIEAGALLQNGKGHVPQSHQDAKDRLVAFMHAEGFDEMHINAGVRELEARMGERKQDGDVTPVAAAPVHKKHRRHRVRHISA